MIIVSKPNSKWRGLVLCKGATVPGLSYTLDKPWYIMICVRPNAKSRIKLHSLYILPL